MSAWAMWFYILVGVGCIMSFDGIAKRRKQTPFNTIEKIMTVAFWPVFIGVILMDKVTKL